jgi:hypothetical protein
MMNIEKNNQRRSLPSPKWLQRLKAAMRRQVAFVPYSRIFVYAQCATATAALPDGLFEHSLLHLVLQ